jgi:anaerobic selenocysteine-containing dehydrogenase
MMNADDAASRGVRRNQPVAVVNDTGRMIAIVRFAPLPRGNLAMYYPEANVLIPRRVDPASGTPVFKSTAVRLVPV